MKSKIVEVDFYCRKDSHEELWAYVYYSSGYHKIFGAGWMPKTVQKFMQNHDYFWDETSSFAYHVKVYEVGHDKLQKHPN